MFVYEPHAAIIRLIFKLAISGEGKGPMGARAIAEWLNERGYSFGNKAPFNNSNVAGILGRSHYQGHYFDMTLDEDGEKASEETWVRVPCPAIVSPEDMETLAALRAVRRPTVTPPRVTNAPTLLTRVATCGLCGAA